MIRCFCRKIEIIRAFFLSDNCSHVSGVTITHLQEHKTTVTTASGNRYTVIDQVKLVDA